MKIILQDQKKTFGVEKERRERILREEQELQKKEAEFLAKKEAALKKLDELKKTPVGKVTEIVATKGVWVPTSTACVSFH